ncbi:MAG TPA: hypothetical protein VNL38_03625 [Candidatus Nitrosotenuis sp.]|nr:hypothetical protein [Candidatus Nitrosotenuis sp.]
MRARVFFAILVIVFLLPAFIAGQQAPASVVVFWEDGFPAFDTSAPARKDLAAALPGAEFVTTEKLGDALARSETRLLIMPFGSAFAETGWPAIHSFLTRGGNLLSLGGRPFTRPAYWDGKQWQLRVETTAYAKQLLINEYQPTPGSESLKWLPNEDLAHWKIPVFSWLRAWSLEVRLSDEDLYPRGGSAGRIDARLAAFGWGTREGRKLSAPLVQIDHLQNNFVGGRWVLLACELPADFFSTRNGAALLTALANYALRGAEDFSVRPAWAVYLEGEPLTLQARWQRFAAATPAEIRVTITSEHAPAHEEKFSIAPGAFPFTAQFTLPPARGKGLHTVTARFLEQGEVRAVYRTGFWVRDDEMLRSGPRVSVNSDYFEINGRTQLIVGTSYMASDVQRQFFMQPNPFVWDRDFAEIRAAGLNMLRTGWWSGWDQVMKESGVVQEDAMRALEAFFLTARKHGLPVQFTFFSFIPEPLGGVNPYLDPEALRRQKELVTAVVSRFKDCPFIIWDLINEPSFTNPNRLWITRPNYDAAELAAWNSWLLEKYSNRSALAEAWREIPVSEGQPVPLPKEEEFSARAPFHTARGMTALKVYDYAMFAQEMFRRWAASLRDTIRATGSKQLITVGQDEGGVRERPSPAFFVDAVDFTTNHTWWQTDALLWDSLAAKQPGKPLLIQETGVTRSPQIDGTARRSLKEQAALLERKVAFALATSAGAIHWLWHVNPYMRDDNEAHIGAIRVDGTEKPEASVLRALAIFAAQASPHFSRPKLPEVAVVYSQAFHYSALDWLAFEAEMRAVRVLEYDLRVPVFVVAENQLGKLGSPKLVILPSPHVLTDAAWTMLMKYVEAGGALLITGSAERDERWRPRGRLAALGVVATPQPIILRETEIRIGEQRVRAIFDAGKQAYLEALALPDGATFRELKLGKGQLFLLSHPAELAEDFLLSAVVYAHALVRAGVQIQTLGGPSGHGVLVRAVEMQDSVLYLLVSESDQKQDVSIVDVASEGALLRTLLPGRARLVLLRKKDGTVLAEFAPESQLRE